MVCVTLLTDFPLRAAFRRMGRTRDTWLRLHSGTMSKTRRSPSVGGCGDSDAGKVGIPPTMCPFAAVPERVKIYGTRS